MVHPSSALTPTPPPHIFLNHLPLFSGLAEAERAEVLADFRLRDYAREEAIFRQGDEGRELYVVVSGKVRIFKVTPSGHETSINIFAGGDLIGEFACLDGLPRSATAMALSKCVVAEMSGEVFLAHMAQHPPLALEMSRLLARKLRWTAAYAETIAQYDAAGRLLHILLLYNEQFGEEIEPGKRYTLDLALNQSDLASLVGARREWVNRLLRDWERRGLLAYADGRLTILDLPRVQHERDQQLEQFPA